MPSRTDVTASSGGANEPVAFGLPLQVDAAIEIPGLVAGPGGLADDEVRSPTRVRLDPERLERRWSAAASGARRMRELGAGEKVVLTVDLAEPAGYLLRARGVGRVLVSLDGGEILCDPLPDHPDWAFILPAQALPLAATLRGLEVFHAAGVVVGDAAVLFAGRPGAGKSSLAAALLRRGAALLGDDAIALERGEGLIAHPSAGTVYLRPAEHDRLAATERADLGKSRSFASRQRYEPGAVGSAAPLTAIFLLERAESGPLVEPIVNPDPFELLATTFNLSVRTPERLTRQLDMVGALLASGAVHRLRVLPGVNATRLAEVVEENLQGVDG